MTIKVTTKKDHNLVLKCDNCNYEEESRFVDHKYTWDNFKLDTGDKPKLNITCSMCGHKHPRRSIKFAKYKSSNIIHLCQSWEEHKLSSKCGVFSGETTDGKIEVIDDITVNSILCKKCAREEGSFYNNREWFIKTDVDKEVKFILLCDDSKN